MSITLNPSCSFYNTHESGEPKRVLLRFQVEKSVFSQELETLRVENDHKINHEVLAFTSHDVDSLYSLIFYLL